MLEQLLRPMCQRYFDNLGGRLRSFSITPNQMTLCAFLTGIGAALSLSLSMNIVALCLLWLSGLCDVLDGTIARLTNRMHPFGAYTDLISDRMVESALILGFALRYPEHYLGYIIFLIAVLFHFSTFVVAGAVMKNDGPKSMHYDRSLIERAEAFILFSLMILYPSYIYPLLVPFNALIFISGITRFMRVKEACERS